MNRKFNIFSAMASGLLMFALAGCQPANVEVPEKEDTQSYTKILITTPDFNVDNVVTRAGSDSEIVTLDALLFDENNKYIETIPASNIVKTADGYEVLLLCDKTDKKRTFHMIANARDFATDAPRIDYSSLQLGVTTIDAVKDLKTMPYTAGADFQKSTVPTIMWGHFEVANILVNKTVDGGMMLRGSACITPKKGEATAENGLNDFQIEGISLCNASSQCYVTPTTSVTAVPTNITSPRPVASTKFDDPEKSLVLGEEPVVYAFDQTCSNTDYLGVIIKASYKGESGYYKILMQQTSGTPYNIIRNHRYNLTITSVNGRGYADITTAKNSLPSNALKATIQDQNADIAQVAADSQYEMGVSVEGFELFSKTNPGETLVKERIAVVYTTNGKRPDVTGATNSWVGNFRAEAIDATHWALYADFTCTGSGVVEANYKVKCDNLELPLIVKWHPQDEIARNEIGYIVNPLNAGEVNWILRYRAGNVSTGWYGMNSDAVTPTDPNTPKAFVNEMYQRYNPTGAFLHCSFGNGQTVYLRKYFSKNNEGFCFDVAVKRHN